MDTISIVDEIATKGSLFSMPQVLSELLEETRKEDFSSKKLSRIILKDPSLASKILRLANSAFYSRPREVSSINQAVSILGVTTVKCFALASSIFHPERIASSTGLSAQELFAYILTLASTSEKIAQTVCPEQTEEALIVGLLADVGIMYLVQHYPDDYKEVVNKVSKGAVLSDAEREIIGMDHCELGYHLTQSWYLPTSIMDAIRNHHEVYSIENKKNLSNIIKLAALLTRDGLHQYECQNEKRLKTINQLIELFEIDSETISTITKDALMETIDLANNLAIDIGDAESLLSKANQEIWKSFEVIQRLYREREELAAESLQKERRKAADSARDIALATLSHYLNNALCIISGKVQFLSMLHDQSKIDKLVDEVVPTDKLVQDAIKKVTAVMREMREISTFEEIDRFVESNALNIDDRIKNRLEKMQNEPDYFLPPD